MTRRETRDTRQTPQSIPIASRVTRHASRPTTFEKAVYANAVVALALIFLATPAFALDTQRADVRAFIQEMSTKHGLNATTVRGHLRNAESKQAIIDAMDRPAEKVLEWPEYRERFMDARRLNKGIEFWRVHGDKLKRAQAEGVSPDVIVGILGVETVFGEITGRYRVLDALATLAFDYPARAPFFRSELENFLLLAREERAVNARTALGSYAGAIGAPQFMPSNYRNLAVDGDGNKRRDLWKSWPDIIMSITNYLKHHGWRAGEPILVSATVEPGDNTRFDTSKIVLNETVTTLRDKGVRFETDMPADTPAMLIVVESRDGTEYRVGFQNFVSITRYNPRIKYALAVHDLGEAIARARDDANR
jgi:membrane-bound lytic murein transglycosylase B